MNAMSVAQAAERLHVSPRRVRAMLHDGVLAGHEVGGRWLVNPSSLPSAGKRAGQPMSARVAWGLAAVAAGERPSGLSASEASRLRARWSSLLSDEDPVAALRSVLSRRAERSRWSAPDPAGLLQDDRVIRSGRSDPRSGMAAPGHAEGYVRENELDDVIADHLLVPADGPENVVLHAVDPRLWRSDIPWLILCADLADAGAREMQQARLLLRRKVGG